MSMDTSLLSAGDQNYLIGIQAGPTQQARLPLRSAGVGDQPTNRFAIGHRAKLDSRPRKVPSPKKAGDNAPSGIPSEPSPALSRRLCAYRAKDGPYVSY